MNDVVAELQRRFAEEVADFNSYLLIAQTAHDADMEQAYHILKDIACEEYIHAKHLHTILSEHDALTAELETAWREAEEKRAM